MLNSAIHDYVMKPQTNLFVNPLSGYYPKSQETNEYKYESKNLRMDPILNRTHEYEQIKPDNLYPRPSYIPTFSLMPFEGCNQSTRLQAHDEAQRKHDLTKKQFNSFGNYGLFNPEKQ